MNATYRLGDLTVQGLGRVRELRRESTEAERQLWRLVRGRNLANVKFRRQHQVGPFVLDLFAPEAMLAIEVDGGQHHSDEGLTRDQARSSFLEANGIKVLRFCSVEVLNEIAGVAEAIVGALAERIPHPRPLPEGEGDAGPLPEGEGVS